MNRDEWLDLVRDNRDKLETIIHEFHPASIETHAPRMRITAEGAEVACNHIRQHVRNTYTGNPNVDFKQAVDERNIAIIMRLFNEAWFGAPESTDVMNFPGFTLMCDLMEGPDE